MNISKQISIAKVDDEKRIVYGLVYAPGLIDSQGDFADASTIEKACHGFMTDFRNIGIQHQRLSRDLDLVECYIAPIDFSWQGQKVLKGSWLIAVHVADDDVWAGIKGGTFQGFSMGGHSDIEEE